MARDRVLEFAVLNVAAHPHPAGIYERLLDEAADNRVSFYGETYATISKPVPDKGLLYGRIVIWTEIDRDADVIDLATKEEASDELIDKIQIPDNVGMNGRFFFYAFRPKDHLMFFETRTAEGKTLSPRRGEKLFQLLLSPEVLGPDSPLVEVTAIPEDDSVERILSLPHLNRLEIELRRPNADDESELAQKIYDELEQERVRLKRITLIAQPGAEGIDPNEETRAAAGLAAHNGYVKGTGSEADGEHVSLSTKEYPKVFHEPFVIGTSPLAALLALARVGHG